MADNDIKYPSFEEVEHSPLPESEGVSINLRPGIVKEEDGSLRRTVYLYGAYAAGTQLWNRTGAQPYTWTILTVVRRDKPSIWSSPIQDPALKPEPPEPPPPPEDPTPADELTIGFFNLDLRTFLDLQNESGRYWAVVWFGDHVSERVEFEIVVDEEQ